MLLNSLGSCTVNSCQDCRAAYSRYGPSPWKYSQLSILGRRRIKSTAWHQGKGHELLSQVAWFWIWLGHSLYVWPWANSLSLLCLSFLICHARACLSTPPPPLPPIILLYPVLSPFIAFLATQYMCVCLFVCSFSDPLHWNWRSMSDGPLSCSPNT